MHRKTRSGRRIITHNYEKRKMTTDKVSHFILFPVVLSSVGKCNDFYLHSLSLCWNDKNLCKDTRCKHLIHGLYLKDKLNIYDLEKCGETGWFTSTRSNDLLNIGKMVGYFIRCNACAVAKALDEMFIPESYSLIEDKEFNDFMNEFKINKTVVPVIVKVDISPESNFDASKFVCLSDDIVSNLVNGEEVVVTRRVKLLKIIEDLHDWAWQVLNTSSTECRQKLISETPLRVMNQKQNQDIRCSSLRKCPSKRYPSHMFTTF